MWKMLLNVRSLGNVSDYPEMKYFMFSCPYLMASRFVHVFWWGRAEKWKVGTTIRIIQTGGLRKVWINFIAR